MKIFPGKLDSLGKIRKYVKSAATEAGLEKKHYISYV